MKSLKDYIFELKDETYLNLAKARKKQGRDISDILSHARNRLIKDFFEDINKFSWSKYITNVKEGRSMLIITFTNEMHWNRTNNKSLVGEMQDDLSMTCKKYGRIIHGVRFCNHYNNEDANVEIFLLDRKNNIKEIKEDTILYHITNGDEIINKILKEGLVPQKANNYNNSYTYNCVFAFRDMKHLNRYRIDYLSKEHKKNYYIIEFKAGDNIYFNDDVLNFDFAKCFGSPYASWEERLENEKSSVYTFDSIDVSQITKVTKVQGKEKTVIYPDYEE